MANDFLYPLRRLHGWLHDYPQYRKDRKALKAPYVQKIKAFQKSKTPFVFLVMTPEHGNIGDHAIAYAETEMLRRAGISYIEITGKQLFSLKFHNLLGLMNGFPILMQGGGYLGTFWFDAEKALRDILQKTPRSRIILLPNTIFYEETDWGHEELQKSIEVYNKHRRLTIYAREKASYNLMKPIYRDVRLMPDMVMSLPPQHTKEKRHGCLLCLRGDHERTRTDEQEKILRQHFRDIFGEDVSDTDMVVPHRVPVEDRDHVIHAKLEEFSRAKLVITDRLHGMVFCAITGTPCIVVDSKSPKVRGCYEWIRHLEYIRFADNASDIPSVYAELSDKPHVYDNSSLLPYYEKLAKVVKEVCRK